MNIRTFIRSLLFPCPGCGRYDLPQPDNFLLCPECREQLRMFPEETLFCRGCGAPMDNALAVCSQCLAEPGRPWQEAISLFPYSGYGKKFLRMLKFANRPDLTRPLGELAAETLQKRGIKPDILIPVPMHFIQMWRRSYNHAGLLAKVTGEILDIPVSGVLKRRYTRTKQAKLKRKERHRTREDFYCTAPQTLRGKHIMLVDDIITTGATLTAAADALKDCEIAGLSILTAARTPAYSVIKR